jgi:hypothetical protein
MGPGVSDLAPSGSGIRTRNSRCRQPIPPSLFLPNTSPSIHASPLIPRPKLSLSTQIPQPVLIEATILLMRRTLEPNHRALALRPNRKVQTLDLSRKPLPTPRARHLQREHDRVRGQNLQLAQIRDPSFRQVAEALKVPV